MKAHKSFRFTTYPEHHQGGVSLSDPFEWLLHLLQVSSSCTASWRIWTLLKLFCGSWREPFPLQIAFRYASFMSFFCFPSRWFDDQHVKEGERLNTHTKSGLHFDLSKISICLLTAPGLSGARKWQQGEVPFYSFERKNNKKNTRKFPQWHLTDFLWGLNKESNKRNRFMLRSDSETGSVLTCSSNIINKSKNFSDKFGVCLKWSQRTVWLNIELLTRSR